MGARREHTWAWLLLEAEAGQGQYFQSYLGLEKTVSCCSPFLKNVLAMCLGDLGSGATSVLQNSSAKPGWGGAWGGAVWIREKREDRAPETELSFAGKHVRNY